MKKLIAVLTLFLFPALAAAEPLALKVTEVAPKVYAIVGDLGQRSPTNLGNNATFGAIVTKAGVVLVDPGGSRKGAAMLERALRTVTDKPVTHVINTGGQDHRWMGNAYFKAKGATIIASTAAVEDQQERTNDQLTGLEFLIGKDGLAGTDTVHADQTFDETLELTVGGREIHLHHTGAAHTPGDAFVWLPKDRVVFTGDIVYLERLLGVISVSDSQSWIEAFQAMAALKPQVVVPGHGDPAPLAKARAETLDYLLNLRKRVGQVLEAGGEIKQAVEVDQSAFKHLANFDQLARRNAQQVFIHMEFE